MKLRSTVTLAVTALVRNKLRSLLTALGIVIGVAAVVMMQAMGSGATAYVAEAISGLGSNMLFAVPGTARMMSPGGAGAPPFALADLESIRREAHDVALVAAANTRVLRLVAGANNRTTAVLGVTPEYYAIRAWGVTAGRVLADEDERQGSMVCLVGASVRDALYPGQQAVGSELRVRDFSCRVVGVLEPRGTSAFGQDQDDIVLMPFTSFSRRVAGGERVGTIMASAPSPDRMDSARDQMASVLRRRRHIAPGDSDDFSVRDPREVLALLQSVTGMLTALLAGVAAISLVVGGIGVMNIMLVSVTERTREIGIRLAVGARSRDILSQFLVESVVLSAAGGLLGMALGLAGAFAAARAMHIPFVAPTVAGPVAFGVSLLVGVVFGVVPARKAARLNPLAALRFE